MSDKEKNHRANRKHLLEPGSLIALLCCVILIMTFQYVGLHSFATGYYLSTIIIIAQVLLTRRHKVIIVPSKIIVTEPLLMSAILILIGEVVNRI